MKRFVFLIIVLFLIIGCSVTPEYSIVTFWNGGRIIKQIIGKDVPVFPGGFTLVCKSGNELIYIHESGYISVEEITKEEFEMYTKEIW